MTILSVLCYRNKRKKNKKYFKFLLIFLFLIYCFDTKNQLFIVSF